MLARLFSLKHKKSLMFKMLFMLVKFSPWKMNKGSRIHPSKNNPLFLQVSGGSKLSWSRGACTSEACFWRKEMLGKGRVGLPKWMNFRKSSKGLYFRFWTFIQGFKEGFGEKNLHYNFLKMREGGSKAVWNFSENSSVLVPWPVPNQSHQYWCAKALSYLLGEVTVGISHFEYNSSNLRSLKGKIGLIVFSPIPLWRRTRANKLSDNDFPILLMIMRCPV